MHLLREMPYHVSWKADSTRYLMLIRNQNEVYMMNRDNAVFKINNLVFPLSKDLEKRLTDTLVDGVRDWLGNPLCLQCIIQPYYCSFQFCSWTLNGSTFLKPIHKVKLPFKPLQVTIIFHCTMQCHFLMCTNRH